MECRPLDIRLLSANDLKNVNRFTKMDVYALVVVSGDPRTRQRSPTDKQGGTNPKWNYSLRFTLDHAALQSGLLTLIFRLRSERLLGDKDIGQVQIPLIQLLDDSSSAADNKEHRLVSYQITTKCGLQKGTLNFSYVFGDKFKMPMKPQLPIIDPPSYPPVAPGYGAYPPAEGASSSSAAAATAYPYPAPYGAPGPGAYPYPPPGPYAGYPPQAAGGYGYRAQAPPQKSGGSNFGLGLGAGILGMGGLLVATDIAEDMAYDAGYDDAMDSMDF